MNDVQRYLRAVAADGRQVLCTGPFDVFLDPDSDHPFSNYAIPRDGAEPSEEAIGEIVAVMQGAARLPRLEFLPATAPAVEQALLDVRLRRGAAHAADDLRGRRTSPTTRSPTA